MNLERIASEKRNVGRERRIRRDKPFFKSNFFFDDIAQQTVACFFKMIFGLLQLLCDDRRNEWICVDLPMRMMQRYANGLALVLEDENVLYETVFLELLETVPPNTNQLVDLFNRLSSKRGIVIRRVKDHFANADRRFHLVDPIRFDRG